MALIQDNHVVKQVASANLAIGVANRTDSASWGNSVQSAFSFFFRNLRYVLVTAYRPVSPDLHRRVPRLNVAAGAADASRAMLSTSCRKVALLTAIFVFL